MKNLFLPLGHVTCISGSVRQAETKELLFRKGEISWESRSFREKKRSDCILKTKCYTVGKGGDVLFTV